MFFKSLKSIIYYDVIIKYYVVAAMPSARWNYMLVCLSIVSFYNLARSFILSIL